MPIRPSRERQSLVLDPSGHPGGFNEDNPHSSRKVDADFEDLIVGLTNFDPAKRLTTHETLAHKWFHDV
jgi:serine/threonine protein kinase